MKAYTDLEQSKKLAEILPLESADMYYAPPLIKGRTDYIPQIKRKLPIDWDIEQKIPCWSLAALLGLMPKLYEFENDPDDGGCQPNLCKGWDNNQWHIVYRSSIYITEWYDDPIDAAVEMVVWLKENKKI